MKVIQSRYNIHSKYDDTHLIYNTKSGYFVSLDEENYNDFLNISEFDEKDETIKQLIEYGFIINELYDEYSNLNIKHNQDKYNKNSLFMTIQMTLKCNFACPYCYQAHERKEISDEKLMMIEKFIRNKIKEGVTQINIHWFGGEPLLNSKRIINFEKEVISKIIEEFPRVKFNNGLTTNGYLLNRSLVDEIVDKTNITDIQITLDGPEDIHNKTRVLQNSSGTFSKIIENVKYLLRRTENMELLLRTNVNKENIAYMERYLETLDNEDILHNNNVLVHFQETHDFNESDNSELFYKDRREYSKNLLELYKLLNRFGVDIPRYSSSSSINCSFDALNSYLFSPDLKLYSCSAIENKEEYEMGYLDEAGNLIVNNSYFEKYERDIFKKDKCEQCKFMPICMGGCSNLERKGDEECIPEKYIFEDIMKIYYDEAVRKLEYV